jgi:hypothetical protein
MNRAVASFSKQATAALRDRYSAAEAMHLYSAIIGATPPIEHEPTFEDHLRKFTQYAADRCITEFGRICKRLQN